MTTSMLQSERDDETPEQRMWKAVLASTVEEWISGPLRHSRIAEDYLFNNERDFRQVCESAGLNPEVFRARLLRFRKTGAGPATPSLHETSRLELAPASATLPGSAPR